MSVHRIVLSRPVKGSSKVRLLASLTDLHRQVQDLPEEACAVLESARVVDVLRHHVGTMGNVSSVVGPVVDAVRAVQRAVRTARRGR